MDSNFYLCAIIRIFSKTCIKLRIFNNLNVIFTKFWTKKRFCNHLPRFSMELSLKFSIGFYLGTDEWLAI